MDAHEADAAVAAMMQSVASSTVPSNTESDPCGLGESRVLKHIARRLSKRVADEKVMLRLREAVERIGDAATDVDVDELLAWCAVGAGILKAVSQRMKTANPDAAQTLARADGLCDKIVLLNTCVALPELEDMELDTEKGTQTEQVGGGSDTASAPSPMGAASVLLFPGMRERAVSTGKLGKLRNSPSFSGMKTGDGSILFGNGVAAMLQSPPMSRTPSFSASRAESVPPSTTGGIVSPLPLRTMSFNNNLNNTPGRIRPITKKGSFVLKGPVDFGNGACSPAMSPNANTAKLAPIGHPLSPAAGSGLPAVLSSPPTKMVVSTPRDTMSPVSPILGAPTRGGLVEGKSVGGSDSPVAGVPEVPEVTLVAPAPADSIGIPCAAGGVGATLSPASGSHLSPTHSPRPGLPNRQVNGSNTELLGADLAGWRPSPTPSPGGDTSCSGSGGGITGGAPISPRSCEGGALQVPAGVGRLAPVRSFSRPPKSHLEKDGASDKYNSRAGLLQRRGDTGKNLRKLSIDSSRSSSVSGGCGGGGEGGMDLTNIGFGARHASVCYGDDLDDFRDAFDTAALHDFGEFLFPNPCDEGLVRYPIGEIHKYLGVFLMRSTGEICMWNPKMCEITGVEEGQACGSHITAFLLAYTEQEALLYAMHDAIEFGDTRSVKVSMSCQEGANRCVVTLTLAASLYPPGNYIMAYCHERVPAEARLDCIIWSVNVLKKHLLELPGTCGDALKDNKALKLVNEDVRKLEKMCGRQRAKAWGTVALPQLLGKLHTHYVSEAEEHGVEVVFSDLDHSIPQSIETDTEHLPQILGYIVHNAIRFTPEGGRVSVGVTRVDYSADSSVDPDTYMADSIDSSRSGVPQVVQSDGVLCFTIEDSGSGIPPCVLQRLNDTVGQGLEPEPDDVSAHEAGDRESGFGLMMVTVLVAECGGSMEITLKHDGDEEAVLASAFSQAAMKPEREASGAVVEGNGEGAANANGMVVATPRSSTGSGPCTGTVVRIYLPLLTSDDPSAVVDAAEEEDDPPLDIRIKALVIQPNAVIRAALCQHLWARKYAVSVASTPDEVGDFNVDVLLLGVDDKAGKGAALERLQESADIEKIDLILTVNQLVAQKDLHEIEESAVAHGVHVLTLPLKPRELTRILKRVEANVVEKKDQQDRIDKLRAAFREDAANVPWERKKKLGTGAFGEVFQAINLVTNGVMAVKVVKNMGDTEESALNVMNEVQLMSNLVHPNVIHYFHSQLEVDSENERRLLIFMEFASGGSLQEKVKKQGKMEPVRASGYVADILQGVGYLHSKNIIHRDIKTANILLAIHADGREVCKVTDFGTAKKMEKQADGADVLATSLKGTPNFMAPEVMNEEPYDAKCDVWSIGCLVLELLTGKLPFAHVSDKPWNVIRYICSLSPSPEEREKEAAAAGGSQNESDTTATSSRASRKPAAVVDYGPYEFDEEVVEFLGHSIVVDAPSRLGCDELRKTPFIESSDFMKLYRKVSMCKRKSIAAGGSMRKREQRTKLTFGVKWDEEEGDGASTKDAGGTAAGGSPLEKDCDQFSGWGSDCSGADVPADVWSAPSTPKTSPEASLSNNTTATAGAGAPGATGIVRETSESLAAGPASRTSIRKSVAFADQPTDSRRADGPRLASRSSGRGDDGGAEVRFANVDYARRRSSVRRPCSGPSKDAKRRQSLASALLQQKEEKHKKAPATPTLL